MLTPFVLTIGPDGSYTLEPDTAPDIEEEDTSVRKELGYIHHAGQYNICTGIF